MIEVAVGRVGRPHGVRGEVSVHPLTDEPTRRFVVGAVLRTPQATLTCATVRRHGERLLLTFDGVTDRFAAEELKGTVLSLDVAEDEETGEDDAWFDHQLEGLDVEVDGVVVGTVARLEHGAGQDLLVVSDGQGRSALVPFVRAIVPVVDVAGGRLVCTPPGGLLDDLLE